MKKETISKEELKRIFRISEERTIGSYVKEGLLPKPQKNSFGETIFDRAKICKMVGMDVIPDEPLLDSADVIKILGIKSPENIKAYCERHKIPYYTIKNKKGSKTYFIRSEIEKALEYQAEWNVGFADFVARNSIITEFIKYVFNSKVAKGLSEKDKQIIDVILFKRKSLHDAAKELGYSKENVRLMFIVACKRALFQFKMMEGQMNSLDGLAKEIVSLRNENKVLLDKLNELSPEPVLESDISILARQIKDSVIPEFGTNTTKRVELLMQKMGVETLNDLARFKKSDIAKHRNVGTRTVDALERLLVVNGLSFKEESVPSAGSYHVTTNPEGYYILKNQKKYNHAKAKTSKRKNDILFSNKHRKGN